MTLHSFERCRLTPQVAGDEGFAPRRFGGVCHREALPFWKRVCLSGFDWKASSGRDSDGAHGSMMPESASARQRISRRRISYLCVWLHCAGTSLIVMSTHALPALAFATRVVIPFAGETPGPGFLIWTPCSPSVRRNVCDPTTRFAAEHLQCPLMDDHSASDIMP